MKNCLTLRPASVGLLAAATLTAGLAVAGSAGAALPQSPSASVANQTLTVEGTNGGDSITMTTDPANQRVVVVDFGNGTQPQGFDEASFNKVAVFLERGDDTFQGPFDAAFTLPLSVSGGAGNDTITGSRSEDLLSGGPGDDVIRGDSGDDLIFGDGGNDSVDGGSGNDTEVLGADDDTALWNPGEGNDTIDGRGGYDTLQFNGSNASENMSLAADGAQAVLVRDVGAVRMDLDRLETVRVAAIGGTDTINVGDLTGTDVVTTAIDLASSAGGSDLEADAVVVNGTNRADDIAVSAANGVASVSGLHTSTEVSGADVTDQLRVNAGGGNDIVTVGDEVASVLSTVVDLGTGQR